MKILLHLIFRVFYFMEEIIKKKCSNCLRIKHIDAFANSNKGVHGKRSDCKDCHNSYQRAKRKTKTGLSKLMYQNQKRNCRHRNHPLPLYTYDEFREWLFSQELFHDLHFKWTDSNYSKMKTPSVDRIDNSKTYSIDNIQLMTWEENDRRAKDDIKKGILTHGNKPQRPVRQLDVNGNFINKFISLKEAYRSTGISYHSICCVCRGRIKTAGGFKWEYI